eukprot:355798-Amphidinium_carterae.1
MTRKTDTNDETNNENAKKTRQVEYFFVGIAIETASRYSPCVAVPKMSRTSLAGALPLKRNSTRTSLPHTT